MKEKVKINESDIVESWVTPPECAGQIVELSYAATEDYILVRRHDRSDDSIEITAYDWPQYGGGYSPQNGRPLLGRKRGTAEIVEASRFRGGKNEKLCSL